MVTRPPRGRNRKIGDTRDVGTSNPSYAAARPVRAYLPEDLDLSFIAPGRRDAASYFVGRLYLGRHIAGVDPDEFQEMYSPLLKDLLGTDYRREVIHPLLDRGVIERDPSYSTGWEGRKGYSRSYRLAPPFRHAQFRAVPLTNPELVRRLRGVAERHAVQAPVHRHLKRWFDRLEVAADYPEDVLPLRAWADGQTRFEPCRQGRLHSNLTNLKKEYRRHLVLHGVGEPLLAVDIKTSQPLLLGLTLRDRGRLARDDEFQGYARERAAEWRARRGGGAGEGEDPSTIPYVSGYSAECSQDIERYIQVCLTEDLYSLFIADTGYTRDDLKKYVLSTFYGQTWHARGSKTGQAFRRQFPLFWEALAAMKTGDQARLPCLMQTVESWLVIWRTCGRLAADLPEAPLLTIHDCVVTTERYVEPVRQALLDEFDTVWGVRPQTETKLLAA